MLRDVATIRKASRTFHLQISVPWLPFVLLLLRINNTSQLNCFPQLEIENLTESPFPPPVCPCINEDIDNQQRHVERIAVHLKL